MLLHKLYVWLFIRTVRSDGSDEGLQHVFVEK